MRRRLLIFLPSAASTRPLQTRLRKAGRPNSAVESTISV